ncbi:MAG: hypothetical protein ISQ14_08295 [Verrucomicrobiae bacterium]|nr:hypothetical protein [Verrucomicrobiae bacterium]
MKHLTQWIAIGCIVISTSAFVAADSPSRPQTPVTPELIDLSAYAEWVDGVERSLDTQQRELAPQWVLWTNAQNVQPGHSGVSFGDSKNAGARHLRIGFHEAVPVGSVVVRGGGMLSVLKSDAAYPCDLDDDSQWIPAQRLVDAEPTREPILETRVGRAIRQGVGLWTLPPGVKTRAMRFTHVAQPADESYAGRLGGVMVLTQRLTNLAPLATPSSLSNLKHIAKIINEENDQWGEWENVDGRTATESERPVISGDNPEWVMLTWPQSVRIDRLLTLWTGFGAVEVLAYVGPESRHPREAEEGDWRSVGVYRGLENGYPVQLWPNAMVFPEPVTTRAIRLRMIEPSIGRHPHTADRPAGGRRVWLGELLACHNLGNAPLNSLPDLKATTTPESVAHAPVPVRFHLPEDGFVTLVIEDETGQRVRNLVSETPFPAGDNVLWWDATDDLGRDVEAARHGLYNIPAQLVSPGRYQARGLWRKEIQPFYEFAVYGTGNPPWSTPDHTGAWLANHSPPSAAVFVPAEASPTGEPSVFLGCYVTEGPDGFAWVDLDGTKRGGLKWIGGNWTAAPYLGRDTGPKAPADVAAYVASTWETDKQSGVTELRVTALLRSGSGLKPEPVVTHRLESSKTEEDRFEQLGGIAAHNGVIVCSFRQEDQLLWVDAVAGKVLGTANVPSPRGVAFDSHGRLLVLSGTRLLRFAEARDPKTLSKPETVISEGLDDPFGLTLDSNGKIYISDHGGSHQVKLFAADGKPIRTIGHSGKPKAGDYDELHMNHPAGLAVDSKGQIWVTEHDYLPKRVSVWSQEGKLVNAFYGPGKYGGGGALDSVDPSRFYYADEARGSLEFALDWNKGTSKLKRILYRADPDFPLPFRAAAPERSLYYKGQRYFTNCYNTNPVAGHSTAFLFHDRDGVAQPAAAMGMANSWEVLKAEAFLHLWPEGTDPQSKDIHGHGGKHQVFFAWSDLNADARVQPEEVWMERAVCGGVTVLDDLSFCVARLNDRAVRFAPARFTEAGVPIYERSIRVVLADAVQRPGSSGGDQVLTDDSGEAVITLGLGPFHQHSLSGTRDGKPVWSYPSPWPGLHASHEAASPSFPGQVIGSTRLMGGLFEVKGCEAGPLWAVNANMGNFYLFTRVGLFVATVFEDVRQGKLWKMPVARRGMSLKGISLHDENFWPTITSTPAGKVYAVDGSYSSLVRLDGLETIRRIDSFPVEVTAEHLVEAQRWVLNREAARQAESGRSVLSAVIHPTGQLKTDGQADDWSNANWVDIDNRGVRANFNSNSKPFNVSGSLAISGDRLHVAWRTTLKDLLRNSGEIPHALFKTGGGLDLMLATNPEADPQRRSPVAGDLRLLVTQVDGKPRAVLYEPVSPGTTSEKVPFSSPWRTVTFDRVEDVSSQIELATDGQGFYEVSIFLKTLGLKATDGQRMKADIGILRGNGTETTARSYWSNKATGITADVPSEAALTPHLWGMVQWTIK